MLLNQKQSSNQLYHKFSLFGFFIYISSRQKNAPCNRLFPSVSAAVSGNHPLLTDILGEKDGRAAGSGHLELRHRLGLLRASEWGVRKKEREAGVVGATGCRSEGFRGQVRGELGQMDILAIFTWDILAIQYPKRDRDGESVW